MFKRRSKKFGCTGTSMAGQQSMKRLLLLGILSFLMGILSVNAFTLANGEVITIRNGNTAASYYLAINAAGTGIEATTQFSERCLWKVSGNSPYQFESIAFSGMYLTGINTNNTPMSVGTTSTDFTTPNNNSLRIASTTNRYIYLNGTTWRISTARTALTVDKPGLSIIHKRGASNRALLENGMQGVHTQERIVYVKAGDTNARRLTLPVQTGNNMMRGYYRWYKYDTDERVDNNLTHSVSYLQSPKIGDYLTNPTPGAAYNLNPGETFYQVPAGVAKGDPNYFFKIACDISQYSDFILPAPANNNTLTEPTLSYRIIYDIRDAREMAAMLDQCTGDKFLEEHKVIAPCSSGNDVVRFGPEYRYITGTNCHYFYNESNPTLIQMSATGTPGWTAAYLYPEAHAGTPSLAGASIVDGRLLQTNMNDTCTVVYTLKYTAGATTYNIARFIVEYKNTTEIGPVVESGTGAAAKAIISDAEIERSYQLLARNSFDYNDGSSSSNFYGKPLPWGESTYGFAYTENNPPRKERNFADWSEYILMRTTANTYGWTAPGWVVPGVDNRGGSANGYFFYVDASERPDKIADLAINGDLCPGGVLYFTAWIADLNNQNGDRPNLIFTLTGVNGEEMVELQKWTTGNIGADPRGKWYQVWYEFELPEEKYELYRIQVNNNGNSSSGNDFAFDDLRIYTNKSSTKSVQMLSDCSVAGDRNLAVLSVDFMSSEYEGIFYDDVDGFSGATVNFQWQNADNVPLDLNSYLGHEGLPSSYGYLQLYEEPKKGDEHVYDSRAAYFAANPTNETGYFFVFEDILDEDGVTRERPILYIIQRTAMFIEDEKYYSVIAGTSQTLAQSECTVRGSFTIRKSARIVIEDGGIEVGLNVNSLCAGHEYDVGVELYSSDNEGNVIEAYCYSDWHSGHNVNENETETLRTYLQAFRAEYPTATSFAQTPRGQYTTDISNYLQNLQSSFTLYQRTLTIQVEKTGEPVMYIIFPIEGTAVPIEGSTGDAPLFCYEPVLIEFKGTAMADFGEIDETGESTKPEAIRDEIAKARLSETDANGAFSLPIYKVAGLQEVAIDTLILYAATDPDYNDGILFYLLATNGDSFTDTLNLVTSQANTFRLKEGYTYLFYGHLDTEDIDDCSVEAVYLNILVVPDEAVWSPVGDNIAWNNDANWKTPDGRPGFVPMSHTNVILKKENNIWPVLPLSDEQHSTETGAAPYITYDLNYEKRDCNNIYFESGAMLINQDKLNYERAYVDMEVPTACWTMASAPMKGITLGDFYVRRAGNTETTFYDSALPPDSRLHAYPFWHSLYSTSTKNRVSADGMEKEVNITTTGWTTPVNSYYHYAPGTGFALWAEDLVNSTNTVTVRFPKTETRYYYFNNSDAQVSGFDNIPRNAAETFKLAFEPDNEGKMNVTITKNSLGKFFVVGNPFMAELDMQDFFDANPLLEEVFYIFDENSQNQEAIAVTSDYTNATGDIRFLQYISPMRSFIVQTKDDPANMELTVTFTSDMGQFTSSLVTSSEVRNASTLRAVSKNRISSEKNMLRIEAKRGENISRMLIAQKNAANADYVPGEDAELLMLASSMSSFGIYSVADDKALSINVIPSIEDTMIPLGIYINDAEADNNNDSPDIVSCTFTGAEGFSAPVYLYDLLTNTRTRLQENMKLELDFPNTGQFRYFLQAKSDEVIPTPPGGGEVNNNKEAVNNDIVVYQSGKETVTIYSTAVIRNIQLVNTVGQLLRLDNDVNTNTKEINRLMPGIYILHITTDAGISNKKIIVR